jgi:hypothetical protein
MKKLLYIILSLLGLAAVAFGHEGHGYVHAEGPTYMIEMDNRDPRCPMARRWTLVDGKDYCVVFAHDTIHLKLLEDDYVHGRGL